MMHLIHRNRVDHFADSPRNISPLRSPFPSGARLSSRIRLVRLTVTVKAMIVSVLLVFIDKGNRNKPCPAGEGGPQRRLSEAIEPRISDAVAVDEVYHTDALSPLRKCKRG